MCHPLGRNPKQTRRSRPLCLIEHAGGADPTWLISWSEGEEGVDRSFEKTGAPLDLSEE